MKILAVDTSTKFLSLGLYDNGKVCAYNLEVANKLSGLLAPTIGRVLGAAGLSAGDIDYFACGLGPGSFTGLRVGIATIKGLSWALGKPVIGIPTLDILAKNAKDNNGDLAVMVDAKRNLIYGSIYRVGKKGPERRTPYLLLTPGEFLKKVKLRSLILGDGTGLYRQEILMQAKNLTILDKERWYPRAHNIIELALAKIKAKQITDSFTVKPIYLYPKECQIRKQ